MSSGRSIQAAAWRRVHIARPPALGSGWAIACILAVLYGALIPFDLTFSNLPLGEGFGFARIRWCGATMEDAITNLLVYLPVGALLALTVRLARMSAVRRVLTVAVVGTGVSLLAEVAQTTIPIRVASWTDVALNGLGATVGALWGPWLWRHALIVIGSLRVALREAPWSTMASILALGLLVYNLIPFDLVTTTEGLHDSLSRAQWHRWSRDGVGVGSALPGPTDPLSATAWFLLLGYFIALGHRECGRPHVVAFLTAVMHGGTIAFVIQAMHLLTMSQVFVASDVALQSVGVMAGAWLAVYLVDARAGSTWMRRPQIAVPSAWLIVFVLGYVVLLLLSSMETFGTGGDVRGTHHLMWVPFEALWRRSMVGALGGVIETAIQFGILAVACGVVLRRAGWARVWWWTGAIVMLVALTVETVQSVTITHAPDITEPALALFAVIVVSRAYPAVRARPASEPRASARANPRTEHQARAW